jgi:aminoglycoside 6'-N-acetyltransferase I
MPPMEVVMRIVDLDARDTERVLEVAEVLRAAFRGLSASWQEATEALEEVQESLGPGRLSRVALDDDGSVLGWIGGISGYGGHAWELHPLAVRPDAQRRGVGRALVADLEAQVRLRGGGTLWLGTDDEDGRTNLAGKDLYPDVLAHATGLRSMRDHPWAFYRKQGFVVVGLLPDASGPGKPDILMAKRITRQGRGHGA